MIRKVIRFPKIMLIKMLSALDVQPIEHHCVALLPVAASTTIVPIMCG